MLLKNMMDLTGHVAIVTGGTGWLGTQICVALCELGAEVYSVTRGLSEDFSDELEGCANFHTLYHDVSKPKELEWTIDTVLEDKGRIDVLVNNSFAWPKSVDFMSAEKSDITATFESGVISPLVVTQKVLPEMIRSKKGSIINVASMYGHVSPDHKMYRSTPGMGNALEYGAAKAALIQSTKYIAALVGKDGVRCNSISPGPFPRPGAFKNREWFEQELQSRTMLNRVGHAEEIKGVIAFLASDMSSYVTGTDIAIDGGWTAF